MAISIVNFDRFFSDSRSFKINTVLQNQLFLHVATCTSKMGISLSDITEDPKLRKSLYGAARTLAGLSESSEKEDPDRYRTPEYQLVEINDGMYKLTTAGKKVWSVLKLSTVTF